MYLKRFYNDNQKKNSIAEHILSNLQFRQYVLFVFLPYFLQMARDMPRYIIVTRLPNQNVSQISHTSNIWHKIGLFGLRKDLFCVNPFWNQLNIYILAHGLLRFHNDACLQ